MKKLWRDDIGIVALEYLLVATIVGLGIVVGLSNLQIALDVELTELANAITALNQSYGFPGLVANNGAFKCGTCVTDRYEYQAIYKSGCCCSSWYNSGNCCVPIDFTVP